MSDRTDEHVIAVDVSCSCGDRAMGLWSGQAADDWAEDHQCTTRDRQDKFNRGVKEGWPHD